MLYTVPLDVAVLIIVVVLNTVEVLKLVAYAVCTRVFVILEDRMVVPIVVNLEVSVAYVVVVTNVVVVLNEVVN